MTPSRKEVKDENRGQPYPRFAETTSQVFDFQTDPRAEDRTDLISEGILEKNGFSQSQARKTSGI